MTGSRPRTCSMVLVDLGKSIHSAIQKLSTRRTVDEKVFDEILKDLCRALLEADVNVRLVASLRNNIKSQVDLQQLSKSTNKKRIIQRVRTSFVDQFLFLGYIRRALSDFASQFSTLPT